MCPHRTETYNRQKTVHQNPKEPRLQGSKRNKFLPLNKDSEYCKVFKMLSSTHNRNQIGKRSEGYREFVTTNVYRTHSSVIYLGSLPRMLEKSINRKQTMRTRSEPSHYSFLSTHASFITWTMTSHNNRTRKQI